MAYDFEQLIDKALLFILPYKFILTGLGIALISLALGIGKNKTSAQSKKPAKPFKLRGGLDRPKAKYVSPGWPYIKSRDIPDLPKPTAEDVELAKQVLGLTEVSPKEGWRLYYDGTKNGDLMMAMAGLRFYAQFISEGGYKYCTSPWSEYENLGEDYWSLGKTHQSFACLELAFKSFQACYLTISGEPGTSVVSDGALKSLASLQSEMDLLNKP